MCNSPSCQPAKYLCGEGINLPEKAFCVSFLSPSFPSIFIHIDVAINAFKGIPMYMLDNYFLDFCFSVICCAFY